MRLPIGIAALMVVGTAITAHAQAAPACETNGHKLTVFDTERREPFSGVLTTIPPNPALLPYVPDLLDPPFGSGQLEIRERLVWDRHDRVIRLITFIIPKVAQFPTSEADFNNPTTVVVERATLAVEKIFTSCSPLPSIMWVGTMRQDFPQPGDPVYPGGWGLNVTGATFAFSTGYTTASNPNPPGSFYLDFSTQPPTPHVCTDGLFNVTESVAGVGVAWAQCAVGTISFDKEKNE
jgi:hypothetical protein